ncbi:MAG: hypothetical protein GEU81_01140 [Nitriliruptorales bacterium]|nr:hypothetical protein [Nitriliruptorales bacterium]
MHAMTRTNPAVATVVGARIAGADLRQRVLDGAAQRLDRLRDDGETGAQAAEYAMLGGVSAAACGGLVALFKNSDVLEQVVSSVITALTNTINTWF